jgi:hypothetical protein
MLVWNWIADLEVELDQVNRCGPGWALPEAQSGLAMSPAASEIMPSQMGLVVFDVQRSTQVRFQTG